MDAIESVAEEDEKKLRIAIAVLNGRMEVTEKGAMITIDRQEMGKKSPRLEGTILAGDQEAETEIETDRIKMTKDVTVVKVPASSTIKNDIQHPTKVLHPVTKRPQPPPKKSRAVLESFWPVSSGANRLAKINQQGDAITWKFSGFAVVLH